MASRGKLISLAVLAVCASGLAAATAAQATYHENLIREVHEGNGVTGDYVELQSYAAGQNQVAGKHIVSYDGGGGVLTNFIIPSNVPNGANQATILIAHDASTPGADFIASTDLNVVNTGGTVCFTDGAIAVKLDCVAFKGTMNPLTVPPGAFGAPFELPGPDLDNQTLVRTISRGCATSLDPADDTNSAGDFSLGTGNPSGNSATPTETQCPPAPPATKKKKKCKKHKKKSGAYSAKKKCKKKKHH